MAARIENQTHMNSLEKAAKALAEELQPYFFQVRLTGSLSIIAKHMDAFTREQLEHDRLTKENNILRGLVAKTVQPCHYCNAENIGKCPYGFPGCNLADDISVAEDGTFKRLLETNRELMKDKEMIGVAIEEALSRLTDAGNNRKHDPSWIRPMMMTRKEVNDCCVQAYHFLHQALDKAAIAKGEPVTFKEVWDRIQENR
jgi:hypothetical protein